ncbi:hypothetical protein CLU79DRAFT_368639 [Phycomyces nitens]|nr:hypothetical protein CLU79DRAFT_368639 [Phycomyces nitens]
MSSQTSEKSSRSISNPKKIRKVSSTGRSSRTRSSNSVASSSSSLAATTVNRAVRAPELPFMKREVDLVPAPRKEVARRAGEASRYIDTKIERSKVNGKPTIKRAGSFTTSARSSKCKKDTAYKMDKYSQPLSFCLLVCLFACLQRQLLKTSPNIIQRFNCDALFLQQPL